MNSGRANWLCFLALLMGETAQSQIAFDLDTAFRTTINTIHVSSILPVADGDVLLSGQIKFADDPPGSHRPLVRVDAQGNEVPWFNGAYGGGRITRWNDRFYVGSTLVRRLFDDGTLDQSFIHMNLGPYFTSFQGGDYHVFDDGRVLLTGRHILNDTVRGYVGAYCTCWFSNEGYLDTTRVHRKCSGVLFHVKAMTDGRFMGSGYTATYDDQPASNIFRFNADGSLDPSFQANATWGEAFAFHPLPDGRVYAAGAFTIAGVPDTLHFVRFLPDGSLDPDFNNHLDFEEGELLGPLPYFIHQLDAGRLIVTGAFQAVEGEVRKGICALDTTGNLIPSLFADCGGGAYDYFGTMYGSVAGILPVPEGFYIWGSYHGYDDGSTNDTTQRMVSRLYGLDVGVRDESLGSGSLHVYPNPGVEQLVLELPTVMREASIVVRDARGAMVVRVSAQFPISRIETRWWPSGLYLIEVTGGGKRAVTRWVKE